MIESKNPLPAIKNIPEFSPQAGFIRPKNSKRNQQWTALFEVVICCGFPTQLLFVGILAMLGIASTDTSDWLHLPLVNLRHDTSSVFDLLLLTTAPGKSSRDFPGSSSVSKRVSIRPDADAIHIGNNFDKRSTTTLSLA